MKYITYFPEGINANLRSSLGLNKQHSQSGSEYMMMPFNRMRSKD